MGSEDGEDFRPGLGPLIKGYRRAQQVTQRELAAAASISLGALRDLEQGRTRFPRWETVELLAVVLGVGPAQRAELARAFRATEPGRGAGRGPRIGVLGPLAAWRDGAQILTLGSARQRAVLGLMALHSGTVVHREAIIDTLWGEQPPPSALAEVQGYVSRLRRLLGAGWVIMTEGGCYRLNVGPDRLDLARFGELTRRAGEAAPVDPALACERYEQALRLWRGDVLADVDLLRGHPAAVNMARRRAEAVLGYADAARSCPGAHARAMPYLRELCSAEPLNEATHARLMTALAATGQQAAALRIFAEVRQRLDDELGIAPSPLLAEAHARVLRQQV